MTLALPHKPSAYPRDMVAQRSGGRLRSGVRSIAPGAAFVAVVIAFCLFYMIALPKGGFKLQNVPITIGYLLTPVLAVIGLAYSGAKVVNQGTILIGVASIALAAWSAVCTYSFGIKTFGFAIAYFVNVLYLPLFSVIFFSPPVMDRWGGLILTTLKWAIRFAILYGIFLFFYRTLTGRWIEIPYVTVNMDDVGSLDDKHINRGGVFKLISTYNNGNIFGVSMAMLIPLYYRIEQSKWLRAAFVVAMLLTLSRTVWLGIVLGILFIAYARGLKLSRVLVLGISLALFAVALYVVMILAGLRSDFLLDVQLGGRLSQFDVLWTGGLVPYQRGEDILEIVYLGIIKNYGYLGLLFFVLFLISPIVALYFSGVRLNQNTMAASSMQGLVIYLILAMSDGAFNYIPVMQIYWMVAAIGISAAILRRSARLN